MPIRHLTMRTLLIVALTFSGLFIFSRYYYNQPINSLIVAAYRNMSTSLTKHEDSTPRDGAFYRAADQARQDEDWEKKICPLRMLSDLDEFYEYLSTRRVPCHTQLVLGGRLKGRSPHMNGDKWTCMDKNLNITPLKCLVFSFGIGSDWSFEDEVEAKLGCKVFAFDPTIEQQTHNRSAKITFFNLGIGDSNRTAANIRTKTDRYSNILGALGHLNSIIDILKIDVEGQELRFFRDVLQTTPNLLKNVKMLSMEVHTGKGIFAIRGVHRVFWKFFQLLDCFGFKIWYSANNPFTGGRMVNGRHRSCCYEIMWIQDRLW